MTNLGPQVWRAKLRYRPILTGAPFSPSIYHKPLPRMIYQPVKLSQMIRYRIESHARRNERHQTYLRTIADIRCDCNAEAEATKALSPSQRRDAVFAGYYDEWSMFFAHLLWNAVLSLTYSESAKPYKEQLTLISQAYERGTRRAQTPFPQALLDQMKEARRERIRNKTKERAREIRGEMTRSLCRRLRQGPPAHVLSHMSPEQRRLDQFARHPSEVGCTALAKVRLGRRLRNPEAWAVEESRGKEAELDVIAAAIRRQNESKRASEDLF